MPFGAALLTDDELKAYDEHVASLEDDALVAEAAEQILSAGYSKRMSRSDQRASQCYKEAVRREKPELYSRGYNRALADAGVSVEG